MIVTLINRAPRMKVFILAHATYCQARGACGCTVVDPRTGRRVAQSLTLPAGMRSAELPDVVLRVTDVARALASGEVGVERIKRKAQTGKSRRTRQRKGSR